ncbi:MAG: DUF3298 domain-containing protein [Alphaproteobacteria bacterium]|nr:DUF3298 domain-containing protein [Alphaproteobacteria bacterium]MBL7096250.1 DUF3298 domain-containing protein [Alphaproteobacteria bacterium]
MLKIFRSAALGFAALVSLGVAVASAAGVPITAKSISWKTKQVEMTVEYPVTGNKAIDAALLAFANKQVADFKAAVKGAGAPLSPDIGYYLDLKYSVERNDGQMLGILFNGDEFLGGAHPGHSEDAFNFLMPDGHQVFLGEILDGRKGIQKLSAIATAQLLKEIATGADAASDADSVKNGAAPYTDNFKVFIWLPSKLHLFFPEYQVASYAAGPQETTIDLAGLKDVIRADWRAPAPSFDCRKAKTMNEKAICGDAALARLDRQVAEVYEAAFRAAYDPAEKKKVLDAQRAFVATTLKCIGDKPNACLTKAYTARLAILTAPPQ